MGAAVRPHAKLSLLTGRPRVQTKWVWGKREKFRWSVFAVKYAIFLGLPWLTVGGEPAVWFDIPNRHYHLFGQTFWPQDFYLLGLFLAIAAVMLFLSTALVSRSWCGFACPQTLLTSLFMVIDHWVEGDRPARLALDGGKANGVAVARRALKHAIWLAVAGWLGFTFTAYFVGAREMSSRLAAGHLGMAPTVTWVFITGVTYMFAGHLRDWVCTTVCPYGRFQGAMQDTGSLVVTYDASRGEPRGKSRAVIERGGCVDCGQCVTACPMGIDIRKGPQFECISCMRCLEACDAMMTAVGAPVSLIRLASLDEQEARKDMPPEAPWPKRGARHYLRPRVLWYGAVLMGLVVAFASLLVTRPLYGIEAMRDRTRVFALPGNQASDFFQLAMLNKDAQPHTVTVELSDTGDRLVGAEQPITLAPGAIASVNASVVAAREGKPPRPFEFVMRDAATRQVLGTARATFVEP